MTETVDETRLEPQRRTSDPAGATVSTGTVAHAQTVALNPATILANNDSTAFFAYIDDLVRYGPTRTNVNDFRAILFDP